MNNAVQQGTYADIKLVKTRGVFQVVIEAPIEQYARFVEMFGGPLPGEEKPVALALLHFPEKKPDVVAELIEGPHPLVQKAGILAKSVDFQKWVDEQEPANPPTEISDVDFAVAYIRSECGIQSRKELATNPEAAAKFEKLVQRYYEAQR